MRGIGFARAGCYNQSVDIRLLGPVDVRDGERVVSLPRRQQRALLAALALRAGEVVSTDRLVADLWGESAPASATGSLQNTVSALRKLLGRDVLVTQAPGYRLVLPRDAVDVNRFERLLAEGRNAEPAARVPLLREALDLWRGPALADLAEEEFARLEAARLDELRLEAQEERIDAELELGRHVGLVGELEQLVATHQLRERLRGQLMLALYRCGRQAEALEVYRAARLAADEFGLDPWPELQELELRVLRQDPSLAAPAEATAEAAPTAADRRLVSVLFATPPAEEDAEMLRRRLDELLTGAREILARHGGVLQRFGPEGLVAVFGAESPRDDDALAAVRAAAELGLPAGVATGESVDGAGAVFVRAAELARGTGVQVDDRTRALVQQERRLDAPLVGRTEELSRLRAAFETAREEGRCRVVTVLGEPGIGKTRLGRELVNELESESVTLVGRCVSYGGGSTFLPLLDALNEIDVATTMSGEPDGDVAVQRLLALGGATDPGTIGESYWAIRRLLETLARERPVLLLLDDVHWAEPALLDLVDYLAERITAAPVLVVCLARPEVDRIPGDELALGPLSDEEARELVSGVAELDEETRESIVALAEGNALYAEQLAAFAADGGEGLPPTLEAVLAGRLGRLDDAERAVLQRAAVVGREFSRAAVSALSDEPVDTALASLSRRGFVHATTSPAPGDDGYRFHHVLLRDTAYGSLTKADRAALHEHAAEWLDRDGTGDDALVGYHLEQAAGLRRELGEDADAVAEKAGTRLGEAAMRIWRQNDARTAIGLLERSVALLDRSQYRAELLWELSLALRLAGRPTAADDALVRAATEATGPTVARVAAERAKLALLAGEIELADAASTITTAIDELKQAADARGLGRATLNLAVLHSVACDLGSQEHAAAAAVTHYDAAGFSAAACYGSQADALYHGPLPIDAGALRCAELLGQSRDRATQAYVTAVLGALHGLSGRAAEARDLLDHARSAYDDLGNRLAAETILAPLAIDIERTAGNTEAAAHICKASLDVLEAAGDKAYSSTRSIRLAELLLDLGRDDEAEQYIRIADETVIRSDVLVQFLRRSQRARLLARAGDHVKAESLAREAVAIASLTDALLARATTQLALAEILTAAGSRRAAKRAADDAARLFADKGLNAKESLLGSLSLT